MANYEHLEILDKGVRVWNRWRKENPDVMPDLSGEEFIELDLSGANLSKADFDGAKFLSMDLSRANLRSATLVFTNIHDTNLKKANLSDVDLGFANLNFSDLTGATISRALLFETALINVCLKEVKGLHKCRHQGPCIIDHRTIQKSGTLPVDFLLGCGLPDTVIDAFRDLIDQHYYSCFISYSSNDQAFVDKLYADLRSSGIRCWYDAKDMHGGSKLREQIKHAIDQYDRVLLILSDGSMNSEWVKTEIADARMREVNENITVLFPIRLVGMKTIKEWECFDADTGKDSAREIREYFVSDFEKWQDAKVYKESLDKLIHDLKVPVSGGQ